MAKSNRRKRQDRVKVGAKRAEQARRRAKAEREQQAAECYRRLLDPRAGPADVAGILAAELPDSLAAGAMMAIRLSSGVPGEEIARTARLMLASATGPRRIGTLAVAAWAAHVTGDEDAERGYAGELLSRADAVDDPELRLEVIRAASVRGHPGEACELIEPYLRGRPDDALAAGIYAGALAGAHAEAEPGERERAALARFGDRSGGEALREAIDAFLGRAEWGATVRKWADAERSRLEAECWRAAERDQFDALAAEVAVTYPVAGVSGSPEAGGAASGDGPVNTPLRAFAADRQRHSGWGACCASSNTRRGSPPRAADDRSTPNGCAPNSASPPRSANACHSRGQGIPAGLVAAEPARLARFAPGPSRKTLMMVTFRPHRVAMSSGSDVRTVTGPGAAKAAALSIASIACRGPCRPASARMAVARRAIGSVTGSTTTRDSVHSSAGRLSRGCAASTTVAALVITRRSSASASASHWVTSRARRTAFASPSLSSTSVPAGVAEARLTRAWTGGGLARCEPAAVLHAGPAPLPQ